MNKKQLIVVWVMAILVVVILGLRTGEVYKLSEILKPRGPQEGWTGLFLNFKTILIFLQKRPFHTRKSQQNIAFLK